MIGVAYYDLAKPMEVRVRLLMRFLWRHGRHLFFRGESLAGRLATIVAGLTVAFITISSLLGGKDAPTPVALKILEFVIFVPMLLGIGMLALYGVLWLLSRPKKGFTVTALTVLFVLSVYLEFVALR